MKSRYFDFLAFICLFLVGFILLAGILQSPWKTLDGSPINLEAPFIGDLRLNF